MSGEVILVSIWSAYVLGICAVMVLFTNSSKEFTPLDFMCASSISPVFLVYGILFLFFGGVKILVKIFKIDFLGRNG